MANYSASQARDRGINSHQYHPIHDLYGTIWGKILCVKLQSDCNTCVCHLCKTEHHFISKYKLEKLSIDIKALFTGILRQEAQRWMQDGLGEAQSYPQENAICGHWPWVVPWSLMILGLCIIWSLYYLFVVFIFIIFVLFGLCQCCMLYVKDVNWARKFSIFQVKRTN